MWVAEQVGPQAPQLVVAVAVSDSQPSVSLFALQSRKPAWQEPAQAPATQLSAAMWFAEQAWPQPPQLLMSVPVADSQPSDCLFPLQSENPTEQAPLHSPPAQLGTA